LQQQSYRKPTKQQYCAKPRYNPSTSKEASMSDQADEAVAAEPVKETLKIGEGKPGPGRPKGLPNKTTQLLKDAILVAAQRAGGGGEDGIANYLVEQAEKNPGPFMSLLGKVLPMTVAGDANNPLELVTRIELVAPRDNSAD
jgi:hypothetical protein